jgi:hypothetical protein
MRVTFLGHECENFTLSVDNIDFRRENIGKKIKFE